MTRVRWYLLLVIVAVVGQLLLVFVQTLDIQEEFMLMKPTTLACHNPNILATETDDHCCYCLLRIVCVWARAIDNGSKKSISTKTGLALLTGVLVCVRYVGATRCHPRLE